jgi:hypothetical protein
MFLPGFRQGPFEAQTSSSAEMARVLQRTGRCSSTEVRIRIVSELCHIPPETPGKHCKFKGTRDWVYSGIYAIRSGRPFTVNQGTTVFDNEVKNGTDAALKAYAQSSITAGNEHLSEARELLAKLKKSYAVAGDPT